MALPPVPSRSEADENADAGSLRLVLAVGETDSETTVASCPPPGL
jgi:hypothetical protein